MLCADHVAAAAAAASPRRSHRCLAVCVLHKSQPADSAGDGALRVLPSAHVLLPLFRPIQAAATKFASAAANARRWGAQKHKIRAHLLGSARCTCCQAFSPVGCLCGADPWHNNRCCWLQLLLGSSLGHCLVPCRRSRLSAAPRQRWSPRCSCLPDGPPSRRCRDADAAASRQARRFMQSEAGLEPPARACSPLGAPPGPHLHQQLDVRVVALRSGPVDLLVAATGLEVDALQSEHQKQGSTIELLAGQSPVAATATLPRRQHVGSTGGGQRALAATRVPIYVHTAL